MPSVAQERNMTPYARRLLYGLCGLCGKRKHDEGTTTCTVCKSLAKTRAAQAKSDLQYRVVQRYGGQCVCCGEEEPDFLTIDHVNRDGNVERKISRNTIYRQALRKHRDDLQVLCFNCNCGRERNNGLCPHKR